MFLADTSIWIRLFGKQDKFRLDRDQLLTIATCPPVIQEVLQGIKDPTVHAKLKERFVALPVVGDPLGLEVFLHASDLYRTLRRRGETIRSSTDCLIASIAIRAGLTVWHDDRDFDAIARHSDLKAVREL